jgi:hypothetical protein
MEKIATAVAVIEVRSKLTFVLVDDALEESIWAVSDTPFHLEMGVYSLFQDPESSELFLPVLEGETVRHRDAPTLERQELEQLARADEIRFIKEFE